MFCFPSQWNKCVIAHSSSRAVKLIIFHGVTGRSHTEKLCKKENCSGGFDVLSVLLPYIQREVCQVSIRPYLYPQLVTGVLKLLLLSFIVNRNDSAAQMLFTG